MLKAIIKKIQDHNQQEVNKRIQREAHRVLQCKTGQMILDDEALLKQVMTSTKNNLIDTIIK